MKQIFGIFGLTKRALALSGLLATCHLGWAANIMPIYNVDVDVSGNIIGFRPWVGPPLNYTYEYNAGIGQGHNAYIGGLFEIVTTAVFDPNSNPPNQPNAWRTINGLNGTYRPVQGIPYPPSALTASNVFKLVYDSAADKFTVSVLSAGPVQVTGVNARVRALQLSFNGDLYLGGEFTASGGFTYSDTIGCYKASGGWQSSHYFCALSIVNSLSWDNAYKLKIQGTISPWLTSITGPIYSGDNSPDTLNTPYHYVYWNTDSGGGFDYGYFSNN